ncbi:MAG: Tetratricopeptide repeat protein [Candidatus Hydrogenedentes bacterium ADurb.Bin101]|nr:MAG: Tetratricopeptide repeat protein [Candidatus Hydrogenedentes bacterium ADurb.Bin101]
MFEGNVLRGSFAAVTGLILLAGCAATRPGFEAALLQTTPSPAYSIALPQPDMVVAVSPVRQTMQIGGSIPALLGAGISAIQDAHNASRIHDALAGYECGAFFEKQLRASLEEQVDAPLQQVRPFSTAAGFHNVRDAREARIEGLRKSDHGLVLDFDLSYGIYGAEGLLATRIHGEATDTESGKVLWRNTITRYSLDLYADTRWRDPMERMAPSYFSPRLFTAEDAISQWTSDDGTHLKACFENSVMDTVAAVLTDMGLEESAEGHYVLGMQDTLEGRHEAAEEHFSRAAALAPEMVEAANGLSLAQAKNGRMDEALASAETLAAAHPDYLPVHYNLAWWYAVEMKSPEKAHPYFDKAVALGASPSRRLEKAMRTK